LAKILNDRSVSDKKKFMKKGDKVHWNWGKSQAEGKIVEKSEKTIKKKIKGTEVTRKGSKQEPSYVIKQENGNEVIKSESELEAGGKEE
jgi:hypothetical protein